MQLFVASNPGLKSRFTAFVDFADYTATELVEIFNLQAKQAGYSITPDEY
jgi:stage V sporulation protein K